MFTNLNIKIRSVEPFYHNFISVSMENYVLIMLHYKKYNNNQKMVFTI